MQVSHPELDFTRVGDPSDLPLGSPDAVVLEWAAAKGYVLVSADMKTMPGHFAQHLVAQGKASAGLILIPSSHELPATINYLVIAALCSDPHEWIDNIEIAP